MINNIVPKIKLAASIYPKILCYKLTGKPTPILVTLGITNRCNLKCKYCFINLENRNKKDILIRKLLNYIDQFIDLGANQFDLQGGEPTLHPDLEKIINRVIERGAECSMATNGFMVEKYLNILRKCNFVCVSLDGLPATTDFNRGKGAHDIAINALELMTKKGISTRIHGVLTDKTTKKDIEYLVSLAKKYKNNVNFVYALDSGVSKLEKDREKGFTKNVKSIVKFIKDLKSKGAPITSKNGAINQVLNWPCASQDIIIENEMTAKQKNIFKDKGIPRCMWGHLACFFNAEGGLYTCPRAYDREGYFVNIGNKTIKEAFNELARSKKCYMCGQMGDLSYSFNFNLDNFKTWLKF